ncbi:beta-lactamase [Pseudoalteromonas sp. SG41-5]|uniref:class C beta-lactamase n=1 Tax=Pseudoalteromonas sp. SG41-5 TaxID=2760975 RepID=UPI0015FFFB6B|nr:class C beta-lactamase [Pseudoalteromonas sp. SG41-5]MBB1469928.1 beta-lactamase [Pseudoalteromonas sp. SG41-5]
MKIILNKLVITTLAATIVMSNDARAENNNQMLRKAVDKQAERLMQQYQIPGLAVGIIVDGKSQFYNYGVANKEKNQAVTQNTLFELGSVSKTFAATFASYAQGNGTLSFDDTVDKYLPELKNSVIGSTKLTQLATYTAGGLPLQFPDNVKTDDDMMQYYKSWQPTFAENSQRLYSNPSIGLFGYVSALSMKVDYAQFLEIKIFPSLGMSNTFVNVPANKMNDYAFGYNASGDAVRVNPGMLDAQAYGIKSTSADMVQFIKANLGLVSLDDKINTVLKSTRKGYYQASTFTQGLAWEMYPLPTNLAALLAGNSVETITQPQPIDINNSPQVALHNGWINKTGSTNGFGAYIVFIPAKNAGIVMLANKYYPNVERVKAAYAILDSVISR